MGRASCHEWEWEVVERGLVLMRVLTLVFGSTSSRLLAKDKHISGSSTRWIIRLAFALDLSTLKETDFLFSWVRTSGATTGPAEGKGKKKDTASSLGELHRRGQWRVWIESKVMRRARRVNAPVRVCREEGASGKRVKRSHRSVASI